MNKSFYILGLIILIIIAGALYFNRNSKEPQPQTQNDQSSQSSPSQMTFFLTSKNPGKGADLGGLAGADNYCQTLAASVGAGQKTWRAYLSANTIASSPAVNARDRIGQGPWQNVKGVVIANNIEELHSNNNITKQTALTEKGEVVFGRGDTPNLHDILTGSDAQGRAIATSTDATCGNWTKSSGGSAMVGHHDRLGLRDDESSRSWNSSHLSRGCSLELLAQSGGGGLFYCFAQ